MKFVSTTSSSNDDYNADFDFALVEIGPEAARAILKRHAAFMAAKSADEELYQMRYWDYTPEWFSYLMTDPDWKFDRSLPANTEAVEVPDEFSLEGVEVQAGECDQMIVVEDGVRWVTIPKHTDIYVTTETIPIAKIREIAGAAL